MFRSHLHFGSISQSACQITFQNIETLLLSRILQSTDQWIKLRSAIWSNTVVDKNIIALSRPYRGAIKYKYFVAHQSACNNLAFCLRRFKRYNELKLAKGNSRCCSTRLQCVNLTSLRNFPSVILVAYSCLKNLSQLQIFFVYVKFSARFSNLLVFVVLYKVQYAISVNTGLSGARRIVGKAKKAETTQRVRVRTTWAKIARSASFWKYCFKQMSSAWSVQKSDGCSLLRLCPFGAMVRDVEFLSTPWRYSWRLLPILFEVAICWACVVYSINADLATQDFRWVQMKSRRYTAKWTRTGGQKRAVRGCCSVVESPVLSSVCLLSTRCR